MTNNRPASKPRPSQPIDHKLIAEALNANFGCISYAADAIGCSRSALDKAIKKDPALLAILEDARERRLDDVERAAFQRARDLSCPNLQKFLLSHLGRNRGYHSPTQSTDSASTLASALGS